MQLEQQAAERENAMKQMQQVDRDNIKKQLRLLYLQKAELRKINLLLHRRIANYVTPDKVYFHYLHLLYKNACLSSTI